MKKIEKYNLDKLIKVTISPERHLKAYEWRESRKLLFRKRMREGMYYVGWHIDEYIDVNNLDEHLYFKDKKIYRRPMTTYYFQGEHRVELYFNSLDEATQDTEKRLTQININLIEFEK